MQKSAAKNIIFILVATPVEEVGRDHDFDWSIIEPSSVGSIIQLAGRVNRHRVFCADIKYPNIALMQINLRALKGTDQAVFHYPGYEKKTGVHHLNTHNLDQIIDMALFGEGVNAIPRIQEQQPLKPQDSLADLEHSVLHHSLTQYDKQGAEFLNGWLHESWFLTAMPQKFNRFRASEPEIEWYLLCQDNKCYFAQKNEQGNFVEQSLLKNIHYPKLNAIEQKRIWLCRDYQQILQNRVVHFYGSETDIDLEKEIYRQSCRYGLISVRQSDVTEKGKWLYSDQLGLRKDKNH